MTITKAARQLAAAQRAVDEHRATCGRDTEECARCIALRARVASAKTDLASTAMYHRVPDDRSAVAMVRGGPLRARQTVRRVLSDGVPANLLRFLVRHGTCVRPLYDEESYTDVSPTLRRHAHDDELRETPPGIFVAGERTLYIRSVSPLVVGHEIMHAVDLALGRDRYLSASDSGITRLFGSARAFVTPYASTSVAEYFAEAGRAVLGMNDLSEAPWPEVSLDRLRTVDPGMADLMVRLLAFAEQAGAT